MTRPLRFADVRWETDGEGGGTQIPLDRIRQLEEIEKAAFRLYHSRSQFPLGIDPHAPEELWEDLGNALYPKRGA